MFKNKTKRKFKKAANISSFKKAAPVKNLSSGGKDVLLFIVGRTPNERAVRISFVTMVLPLLLNKDRKKVQRAVNRKKIAGVFRR